MAMLEPLSKTGSSFNAIEVKEYFKNRLVNEFDSDCQIKGVEQSNQNIHKSRNKTGTTKTKKVS